MRNRKAKEIEKEKENRKPKPNLAAQTAPSFPLLPNPARPLFLSHSSPSRRPVPLCPASQPSKAQPLSPARAHAHPGPLTGRPTCQPQNRQARATRQPCLSQRTWPSSPTCRDSALARVPVSAAEQHGSTCQRFLLPFLSSFPRQLARMLRPGSRSAQWHGRPGSATTPFKHPLRPPFSPILVPQPPFPTNPSLGARNLGARSRAPRCRGPAAPPRLCYR